MLLRMGLVSMKSGTLVLMVVVAITSLAIAELVPQIPSRGGGSTNDAGDEVDAEVKISSCATWPWDETWPCCNKCGICTRSIPPLCTCADEVLSCHPSCKNCLPSPKENYPQRYLCLDLLVNFCKKTCDPPALLRLE